MNMISVMLILLLFGCAQPGPIKPETGGNIGNGRTTADDSQQIMLERARALKESNPELFGKANGVLIIAVVPGSQGEKAGLKPGDILLTYGDTHLNSVEHLTELTGLKDASIPVMLIYLRNQEPRSINLMGGRIGIEIISLLPSQLELLTKKMSNLLLQGNDALSTARYEKAMESYQNGLKIANDTTRPAWKSKFLLRIGFVYDALRQYPQAFDHYQQSLVIARAVGDRQGEATILRALGGVYFALNQYVQALDHHQRSLVIFRDIGDRQGEAGSLGNIGNVYVDLSQYTQAIDYYQQSLVIFSDIGDRKSKAKILNNLGRVYYALSQYPQALDYYQQSLLIHRNIHDRKGEADTLANLSDTYYALSQYTQALDHCQQSLMIFRDIDDRKGVAISLNILGRIYYALSQYPQALDHHQQSLMVFRDIGDRKGEASNLSNLGSVYHALTLYPQALDYHQQSLEIFRNIDYQHGAAISLNKLGNVYADLSQYPQALDYFQQSLVIARAVGDRQGEAAILSNLGRVYFALNQYVQALDHYQQSLVIARAVGDRQGEAGSLIAQGHAYLVSNQYPQALDYFQQSLAIARDVGDRRGEARSLVSLGNVYYVLSQYPQALDYFQQSLAIYRDIGDRKSEVGSLYSLGNVYYRTSQYLHALTKYRRAQNILVQINVPSLIWPVWAGLSKTLYQLEQPQTAIFFGKQAINTLQVIRSRNLSFKKDLQDNFLDDKAVIYQQLAKMLVEQGRIAEAEQVIAMLKEEEYFDFIQRHGQDDPRTTQVGYTQVEKGIAIEINQFSNQLVSLGKEYENLQKLSLIDEQAKVPLTKVAKELEQAKSGFLKLLSGLEGYFKHAGGDKALELGELQLRWLERQQETLGKHQAVIITTIATKEKLLLLLTTPEVQLARESAITEKDLNNLIKRFRNALQHSGSDPVPLAQELYTYLIKPLEKDLQQAQARTLMWSLGGALRYVPLATLHDGQQFLIEKYGLSLYTAAAYDNLRENNVSSWRGAGLGVSQAHPGFEALPSVSDELRNIIRENNEDKKGVLLGKIYLDQDFNRETFKTVVRSGYPVLHIASHFKLQPGDGSRSKLLLGDGDTLSLDEFRLQPSFKLRGVDLLTLSACDTAVGDKGAGGEVESFAVMAQLSGANGVLASLWQVADESTALLMQQFYRLLSGDGRLSKAEALRQAQIKLLRGEIVSNKHGVKFSHPYFWAPFVLMGNWL